MVKKIQSDTKYELNVEGECIDVRVTDIEGKNDPFLTISGSRSGYLRMPYSKLRALYNEVTDILRSR